MCLYRNFRSLPVVVSSRYCVWFMERINTYLKNTVFLYFQLVSGRYSLLKICQCLLACEHFKLILAYSEAVLEFFSRQFAS